MSNEPLPRIDLLGVAELALIEDVDLGPVHAGLPADREARIAARRAFVGMKQLFQRAVADLEHRKAAWLRAQVRAAEDPVDLWLLRGPLLAALKEDDHERTRKLRGELYRSLDNTFPMALGAPELNTLPASAWF